MQLQFYSMPRGPNTVANSSLYSQGREKMIPPSQTTFRHQMLFIHRKQNNSYIKQKGADCLGTESDYSCSMLEERSAC